MRKLLILPVTMMLVLVSACLSREPGKPKVGDWDGTNLTICDVPPGPPPGEGFGPRPGFVHILVVITADLYRRVEGKDVCTPNIAIPFDIYLDAKLDGVRAVKLDRGRTMPWSERLVTPHFEHLYAPLTGRARIWQVWVHALHEEKHVTATLIPRSYIRCVIFVDGNQVTRNSVRIRLGMSTASCSASGPVS